jgi:hypothetical protein
MSSSMVLLLKFKLRVSEVSETHQYLLTVIVVSIKYPLIPITRCRSGAAITLLVDEVVVTVVATVNKSESI